MVDGSCDKPLHRPLMGRMTLPPLVWAFILASTAAYATEKTGCL